MDDEEFCLSSMMAVFLICKVEVENKVDFCICGEDAVKQVTECYNNGISYSLIFTDFSMPGTNGIDATSQMRDLFSN